MERTPSCDPSGVGWLGRRYHVFFGGFSPYLENLCGMGLCGCRNPPVHFYHHVVSRDSEVEEMSKLTDALDVIEQLPSTNPSQPRLSGKKLTVATKFKAKLLADDKRTGYKKGMTFDPKGVYWHKKDVILVGSRGADHVVRLSFRADIVEVELK